MRGESPAFLVSAFGSRQWLGCSRAAAVSPGQSRVWTRWRTWCREGLSQPEYRCRTPICPGVPARVSAATASLGKGPGATWAGLRRTPEGFLEPFLKRPPQALIISQPCVSRLLTAEAGSVLTTGPGGPVRGPGLGLTGAHLGAGLPNGSFTLWGLKPSISASDQVLQTNQY